MREYLVEFTCLDVLEVDVCEYLIIVVFLLKQAKLCTAAPSLPCGMVASYAKQRSSRALRKRTIKRFMVSIEGHTYAGLRIHDPRGLDDPHPISRKLRWFFLVFMTHANTLKVTMSANAEELAVRTHSILATCGKITKFLERIDHTDTITAAKEFEMEVLRVRESMMAIVEDRSTPFDEYLAKLRAADEELDEMFLMSACWFALIIGRAFHELLR